MPQTHPSAPDRPRVIRAAGSAPEEPDRVAKAILDAYDAADRQGSRPASLTMQWDDATAALDFAAWQGFRDGSLSLEAVAVRLRIESGADAAAAARAAAGLEAAGPGSPAPGSPGPPGTAGSLLSPQTLKHPLVLGGCGLLLLLGVLVGVAIVVRLLVRRPAPRATPPPLPPADRPTPLAPPRGTPRPPAQLRFLSGPLAGRVVPLPAQLRIGRETAGNDLVLEDPSVSRHHALIAWEADGCRVRDLGSSNGSFLNGLRLDRPALLGAGDQLTVGQIRIEVL